MMALLLLQVENFGVLLSSGCVLLSQGLEQAKVQSGAVLSVCPSAQIQEKAIQQWSFFISNE